MWCRRCFSRRVLKIARSSAMDIAGDRIVPEPHDEVLGQLNEAGTRQKDRRLGRRYRIGAATGVFYPRQWRCRQRVLNQRAISGSLDASVRNPAGDPTDTPRQEASWVRRVGSTRACAKRSRGKEGRCRKRLKTFRRNACRCPLSREWRLPLDKSI